MEGYEMDYSEYLHDISIRDLLDIALGDEEAQSTAGFEHFAATVAESDLVFRSLIARGPLIRPKDSRWWRRSLPPHGGDAFVEDAEETNPAQMRTTIASGGRQMQLREGWSSRLVVVVAAPAAGGRILPRAGTPILLQCTNHPGLISSWLL